MDTIRDVYEWLSDVYKLVYPFIPSSFMYSINLLFTQLTHISHTLLTSPSDLPKVLPAILSTIALAISVYWTVTSTLRATRAALRVTIFVIKYGAIIAIILGGLGLLNPDYPQSANTIPGAILSGWHTLTRSDQPTSYAPPKHGKPWEKFHVKPSYPPSTKARSKANGSKAKSPARSSRSKGGKKASRDQSAGFDLEELSSWWPFSGGGDQQGGIARHILEYAFSKVSGASSPREWPEFELPDALKGSWDEIKERWAQELVQKGQREDDSRASKGTNSR